MRAQGSLDSFGTILSGLAKRLGLQSQLFELRLQQQWRDIAGEPIGSHTWPVQIRFKKLSLLVRNSVWLQQLTFLKPELIARLNEKAGSDLVTDIAFRIGEIPLLDRTSEPSVVPPAGNRQDVAPAEVAARLSAIQDPELRQRLTEVIGTYPSQPQAPPESGPSRVP